MRNPISCKTNYSIMLLNPQLCVFKMLLGKNQGDEPNIPGRETRLEPIGGTTQEKG